MVFIKAPSPCTLKTLGLALYVALTDLELSATLKEHDIWRRVRHQMHAQLVSVVMVDEFHHALRGRTGDERRALVETLKNLVLPDPNDPLRPPGAEMRPISLVLSGMPWLRRVLKEDFQLLRRCIFMPISRTCSIDMPGIDVSIALPSMCWEYSATARERRRSIALVCGER